MYNIGITIDHSTLLIKMLIAYYLINTANVVWELLVISYYHNALWFEHINTGLWCTFSFQHTTWSYGVLCTYACWCIPHAII